MYYVYLLKLKNNQYYAGSTSNLERRLKSHKNGKNLSTQIRKPLELIYYEAFLNKFDALRRERYFKTTKGKTSLKQILREHLTNK